MLPMLSIVSLLWCVSLLCCVRASWFHLSVLEIISYSTEILLRKALPVPMSSSVFSRFQSSSSNIVVFDAFWTDPERAGCRWILLHVEMHHCWSCYLFSGMFLIPFFTIQVTLMVCLYFWVLYSIGLHLYFCKYHALFLIKYNLKLGIVVPGVWEV